MLQFLSASVGSSVSTAGFSFTTSTPNAGIVVFGGIGTSGMAGTALDVSGKDKTRILF